MRLTMCCIYDKRAQNYGTPMCYPTEGVALRAFQDSVNSPDNIMNKHPEDFELYNIGTFDTSTSLVDDNGNPKKIVEAIQVVHSKQ